MDRVGRVVVAVIGVPCIAFAAAWVRTSPTEHVAMPDASVPPTDVVARYVRALDARDFTTAHRIFPATTGVQEESRWSLHHPTIRNLHVTGARTVRPGSASDLEAESAPGWQQVVVVTATATVHHAATGDGTQKGEQLSFHLVRHDADEAWQILDDGSG